MADTKILLKLDKKEKEVLKKIVLSNNTTMTEYIKYRVFFNNPEVTEKKDIFEKPSNDKHHYLTIGMLQELYLLMIQIIAENKNTEETEEIQNYCRERAKKNIAKLGYLKIENK